MEKLSDYIPIVIILVSVVFSIIGKAKKQAKVTQRTTLPGTKLEIPVEEKKLQRPPAGSYPTIFEERPKKQPVFVQPEMSREKKAYSSLAPANVVAEPEEEAASFSLDGDDDIIKAIIYSEIINKKEWL